jgi:hypothetical protein
MRVLFPSAHHDRFSHSLGVYHLGNKAIAQLINNAQNKFPSLSPNFWDCCRFSFQIACLMHDCAHSPFSHTFEKFYDYEQATSKSILNRKILDLVDNSLFQKDFENSTASQHERVSAIILLKRFKDIINRNGDAELVVRMILGCLYKVSNTDEKIIKNVFIKLLNSKAIDVDKLDYILRDTWSSGVNNISIDVDRLLSSITITETENQNLPTLGFKKSGLSVLKNVIDARNYLYLWVYGHHKVIYEQKLMKNSINKLSEILSPINDPDDFRNTLFSVDSFLNPISYQTKDGKINIFLPTDGDIIYLIKKYRDKIQDADRWLHRKHQAPIWKTFFEFHRYFQDVNIEQRETLLRESETVLNDLLKNIGNISKDEYFRSIEVEPQILPIAKNMIYVDFEGKGVEFNTIPLISKNLIEEPEKHFFYTYGPRDFIENNKKKIISALLSLIGKS